MTVVCPECGTLLSSELKCYNFSGCGKQWRLVEVQQHPVSEETEILGSRCTVHPASDYDPTLEADSKQPPVSDELRQAALRLVEHAKKMPPHAQVEHSRMVANYLIDDLSAALQEDN